MVRATLFLVLGLGTGALAAIEGVVLQANLGHVTLVGGNVTERYASALGFGFEAGIRANPLLDVQFGLRRSSHSGLSILNPTMSAEFRVSQFYDIEMTAGAGPGFYVFDNGTESDSKFGIQFGGAVDVVVEEVLKFGIGVRYHSVFSPVVGASHWSVLMRIGYTIGLAQ